MQNLHRNTSSSSILVLLLEQVRTLGRAKARLGRRQHDVSLLLGRVLPSVPPVDMGKYSPLAAGAGALQLY